MKGSIKYCLSGVIAKMASLIIPRKSLHDRTITFFNNTGELELAVSEDNLFYIRSNDNYIDVWYADGEGSLRKHLLRSSLKTVEDTLGNTAMARCHRQFIVNTGKVKILRRRDDGYELELENPDIPPIPVSSTYAGSITACFSPCV